MIEATPVIEKSWKPNSGKQSLYAGLPDSIFEQFYGGAAGGGKSEILLMKPLLRNWIDNNRFQALILRRTYKELEESLIERSKRGGMNKDGSEIPSFYDFGADFNEQKKKWRFPSGATITFGHAEEEADVRKYDTAEYQYAAFDELTSFTEFQYKFIAFSRVRSVIPSIPALVCSASNPGNIGHRWVRERFVEPAPKGSKIIVENIKGVLVKRIFIPAFLTDNPRLMENDPLYITRLEMLPEADRRAKLYGDWWTFEGQVFGEFRDQIFPDEPLNASHVISPTAIYPNGKLVIYKEFTCQKTTVEQWTAQLANICLADNLDPLVVIDPSAWQNRGQGTIADQFSKEWKRVFGKSPRLEKADNDRISGKMLVHDYLRWRSRPKYNKTIAEDYDPERAAWIMRNHGIQAHKLYLAQFTTPSDTIEEDIPRLQITKDCPVLIKTIPLCVYDEKNIEDVKEFDGDDPYDNLRYLLKTADRFKLEDLPQILSIDWGFSAMTHAMWATSSNKLNERYNLSHPTSGGMDWNVYYRKLEIDQANKPTRKYIVMGRRRGVAFR